MRRPALGQHGPPSGAVAGAAAAGAVAGAAVASAGTAAATTSAYDAGVAAGSATAAAAMSTGGGAYVMGAIYPTLPGGCAKPTVQGQTYYLCANTWFQPTFGANGVSYKVVPTP